MLRISLEPVAARSRTRLIRLEGQLRGPWVGVLERVCAETVRECTLSGQMLTIDLQELSYADGDGINLLLDLAARHVSLTHGSPFVTEQLKRGAPMIAMANSPTAGGAPQPERGAVPQPERDATGTKEQRAVRAGEGRLDERDLLPALRAGHEWAFETMVRLYGGRLLSVARRLTRNEDDAREVLQSAYLSAFQALGSFEGNCQLSTWLHRIVVNAALMRLRSRRRKPEGSIEVLLPAFQDDGHHVEQFGEWCAPADRLIEREETRAFVRACIDQLPDSYRQVLLLRDIEELNTQEVAEMLSITHTAVKVRLHRARQALSTLLRREYAPSPRNH